MNYEYLHCHLIVTRVLISIRDTLNKLAPMEWSAVQFFHLLISGRATEHAYGRTHEESFHAPGNSKADQGAALSSGNANAHRGLYNEAYIKEGHFNSDAALQNDLRMGR